MRPIRIRALLLAAALLCSSPALAQLPLRVGSGGTGATTFNNNDVIFFNGVKLSGLAIGSVGDCLKVGLGPALGYGNCGSGTSYETSTTAADGVTTSFAFSAPVTSVVAAFVGGMAQKPGDISVVAGNIVLGAGIPVPPAGVVVSALLTFSGGGGGGGTTHNLLSATHADTTAAAGVRGDLIVFGAATWARFGIGTQYQVFQAGVLDPAYGALHLDQSAAITGILPVANGGTGSSSTAMANRYLKGSGSIWGVSSGAASGTGGCTNQFPRTLNSDAAPTCATVTPADSTGFSVIDSQTFTASGTWTKPTGAVLVHAMCMGPGSGGGSGASNNTGGGIGSASGGGGAGGGAFNEKWMTAAELPGTVAVTVPAGCAGGGAATAADGNNGTQCASATFGTYLLAGAGGAGGGGRLAGSQAGGGGGGGTAGDGTTGTPTANGNGGLPQLVVGTANAIAGQGAGPASTASTKGGNSENGGSGGGQFSTNSHDAGGSIHGGIGGAAGAGWDANSSPLAAGAGALPGTYVNGGGNAGGSTPNPGSGGGGTDGDTGTVTNPGKGCSGGGAGKGTGGGASGGSGGRGGIPGGGGCGGGAGSNNTIPSGAGGTGGRAECRIDSF